MLLKHWGIYYNEGRHTSNFNFLHTNELWQTLTISVQHRDDVVLVFENTMKKKQLKHNLNKQEYEL